MKLPSVIVPVLFALSVVSMGAKPIDVSKYEGPIKVACVGDSITQGAGAKGNSYPKQLQALLGEKWKIGNFGLSGRTLMNKGDRPYMKEKAYKKALEMQPDVVIIMLGTNDTKPKNWKFKDGFYADYQTLVSSFQALESKPRIYVCRPCPVPGKGNFGINEAGIQEQIPQVDKLAKEMNLGVIDMHAALVDTPEFLPDRVHPNADGAGKMAEAAYKVLTGKQAAK
ncbi:MAG: GDSL-type esterase/lipase family protein [Akkermansiaceae bacterium]